MRQTILIIGSLLFGTCNAQTNGCDTVETHRLEHANTLNDTNSGVLNQTDLNYFKSLNYFPCDESLNIPAVFKKDRGRKFKMPTSTERTPIYRRYGYVYFTLNGERHQLTVYQNMGLRKNPGYEDYLFLPFRDATSGLETYGGGRYLDLRIPQGDTLVLNFNLAYNPYCAYSHRYSCPIPPKENTIKTPIKAGEQTPTYYPIESH